MSYWRDQAACLSAPDPDIFFSFKLEAIEEAKEYCMRCPVAGECLSAASVFEKRSQVFGVWGGRTAVERRPSAVSTYLRGYGLSKGASRRGKHARDGARVEGMVTLKDILKATAPLGVECSYTTMYAKMLNGLPAPVKAPGVRAYLWVMTPGLSKIMVGLSGAYQERLAWRRRGAVTRVEARQILSGLSGASVDSREHRYRWLRCVQRLGLQACCPNTVWGESLYDFSENQEGWVEVYREVPGISVGLLDQVVEQAVREFSNGKLKVVW